MNKYIGDLQDFDAIIELLEIIEIDSKNKLIKKMQDTAISELKDKFETITNSDWWLKLLLDARKQATKSS